MDTILVDEMGLTEALYELDIKLEKGEYEKLNKDYIKKKYYKLALKWHPDKNKEEEATKKFQKIGKAYSYLINEMDKIEEKDQEKGLDGIFKESMENNVYVNILIKFVSTLLTGNYNYKMLVIDVIKELVINKTSVTSESLEYILKDMNKQIAVDLYRFINKYKNILYIQEELIEIVYEIIRKKYAKDEIYILKPTLKDIIHHNIYKLYIKNNYYLVPLWHNELYFDLTSKDGEEGKDGKEGVGEEKQEKDNAELIVFCQPILPKDIWIDDENNIVVEKKIDRKEWWELLEKEMWSIEIGEKPFLIRMSDLYMKKQQTYIFKGQGIANINDKYIYDTLHKSDIIVNICLM